MGAYSFQKQFIRRSAAETSNTPSAAFVAIPMNQGTRFSVNYAMRTRWCKKIGEWPCVRRQDIVIVDMFPDSPKTLPENVIVRIDTEKLSGDEMDRLARADGFKTFPDMVEFWNGRLPFVGHIIHWKYTPGGLAHGRNRRRA